MVIPARTTPELCLQLRAQKSPKSNSTATSPVLVSVTFACSLFVKSTGAVKVPAWLGAGLPLGDGVSSALREAEQESAPASLSTDFFWKDSPARLEVSQCQPFPLRLDLESPFVRVLYDPSAPLVDFCKHRSRRIVRDVALLLSQPHTLQIDKLRLQCYGPLGIMSSLCQTQLALQDLFLPIVGRSCPHLLHRR
jgi:hypothetical protein